MNDQQPWKFTCKTCGAHKLTVSRVWKILAGPDSETWQEWGPLEANHKWHFKFKEKIEKVREFQKDHDDQEDYYVQDVQNERVDYRQNFGEYADDNAISEPADYEIYDPQDNQGNDMFYVNCAGCGREIEFGWSQPNRSGLIFPTECSNFNPKAIWPEPRYLDSWHKKHWL